MPRNDTSISKQRSCLRCLLRCFKIPPLEHSIPEYHFVAASLHINMKALTQLLAQLGLFAALGSAYLQDPPTSADPSTVSDCSWWIIATSTDTCAAIAGANGISVSDFELVYVCVENLEQSRASSLTALEPVGWHRMHPQCRPVILCGAELRRPAGNQHKYQQRAGQHNYGQWHNHPNAHPAGHGQQLQQV